MVKRIILYVLYVVLSVVFVVISVNTIFTDLHDGGQFGMLAGLVFSQIVLPLILFKFKWWVHVIVIIALIIIPISVAKLIASALYQYTDGSPSGTIDLSAFGIHFLISIFLLEISHRLSNL